VEGLGFVRTKNPCVGGFDSALATKFRERSEQIGPRAIPPLATKLLRSPFYANRCVA
jgi:hypothetical protein